MNRRLRESYTPSLMTKTVSTTPYAAGPAQPRVGTQPLHRRSAADATDEPFTQCTVA
jgi:hypothetical protein